MANGYGTILRSISKSESDILGSIASLDANIASNYIKYNQNQLDYSKLMGDKADTAFINTYNLGSGIDSALSGAYFGGRQAVLNYETNLNQLNRQYEMAYNQAQFGLQRGALRRAYQLNQGRLDFNTYLQTSGFDKKLVDLQTEQQLLTNFENLRQLNFEIKKGPGQESILQKMLGNLANVGIALGNIGGLNTQARNIALERNEVLRTMLDEQKRTLEYGLNAGVSRAKMHEVFSNNVQTSKLLSNSQVLDQYVASGAKLSELLARIDLNDLEQRKILNDSLIRKEQLDIRKQNLEIQKGNVNLRIKQLKDTLEFKKEKRDYYRRNAQLIKEVGRARKSKISVGVEGKRQALDLLEKYSEKEGQLERKYFNRQVQIARNYYDKQVALSKKMRDLNFEKFSTVAIAKIKDLSMNYLYKQSLLNREVKYLQDKNRLSELASNAQLESYLDKKDILSASLAKLRIQKAKIRKTLGFDRGQWTQFTPRGTRFYTAGRNRIFSNNYRMR